MKLGDIATQFPDSFLRLKETARRGRHKLVYIDLSLYFFAPLIFFVLVAALHYSPSLQKSEKSLVTRIFQINNDETVFYLGNADFSARFYSKGKVKSLTGKQLEHHYRFPFYLVAPKEFDLARVLHGKRYKFVDSNSRNNLYKVGPADN